MNRKVTIVVSSILGISILTATLFLIFPYDPYNPPVLDDSKATPEGLTAVVNASNQFALDFFLELVKQETGNILISPYSIFSALAMVFEGANGTTAAELANVLHFPDIKVLRNNYAGLYNLLNDKAETGEIRTGNALWVQKDFPLLQDFLARVENSYGGKAANLNFVQDPDGSRKIINQFIEDQTNDKIKELLKEGSIDALTRVILTNTIYFRGEWAAKFNPTKTIDRTFTTSVGTEVETPIMVMSSPLISFNYTYTNGTKVLELPYKDSDLSMLVFLPDGSLEEFESTLSYEQLFAYRRAMGEREIDSILFPKFKAEEVYDLVDTLQTLGMPEAFSENANFSNMCNITNLGIRSAVHQTYINVDESGTEAAGASFVLEYLGIPSFTFEANRPFLYLIQDQTTGLILFLGRMTDPTQ